MASDTDTSDPDIEVSTGEGADEGRPPGDDSERPTDEIREGLVARFGEALGDKVRGSHIEPGREVWVRVDRDAWTEAAELAKLDLGCTFFDFLSALDWMPSPWGRYEDAELDASAIPKPDASAPAETGYAGGDTRFQVFCRLADIRRHHSVVLKADLPAVEPGPDFSIASLVPLYDGANWHERECWEMFGIDFEGHPDLRHIYLPGHFEGYPLRKDFPLLARLVKPWPGVVDIEPMPEQPGNGDDPAAGSENAAATAPQDADEEEGPEGDSSTGGDQ